MGLGRQKGTKAVLSAIPGDPVRGRRAAACTGGLGACICWGVGTPDVGMWGVAGQAEKMGGTSDRAHLDLLLGTFRCVI